MTDETTTEAAEPTVPHCYRHPKRETYVRCQRCGRYICGECQIPSPVGVHCPEEDRGGTERPLATRVARAFQPGSTRPVVTYVLIGLAIIGFILEVLTGDDFFTGASVGTVGEHLLYYPGAIVTQPWSLITVNFTHANILHILFNMYSLFVLGPILERYLGRWRFIVLFFLTGIGGLVAVDFFTKSAVVGASGAIFGLLGVMLVLSNRIGLARPQLYITVGLNLVIGRFVPGIAWQAHVGGLIAGILLGLLIRFTVNRRRFPLQVAGYVVLGVGMIVALAIHAGILNS
jgi:membrane associated rhomboid family serine protease